MRDLPHSPFEAGPDGPGPVDGRAAGALDHRRATEPELVGALLTEDLLALAECWQRTSAAAHAVARRLMGSTDDIELLLAGVYGRLWDQPPHAMPLERWVRAQTFALGVELLQQRARPPAAPSCALLLPHLPPPRRPATDPVERVLAELPPGAALALVRAHDAGIAAEDQPDPGAGALLESALEALAHQTIGADAVGAIDAPEQMGDFVLGLTDVAGQAALQQRLQAETALAERVRFLRRGRRRLEGLPPAPELGPRVLMGVVAGRGAAIRPPHPSTPTEAVATRAAAPQEAAAAPDADVVITVARPPLAAEVAGSPASAAEQDTGPIALIAPPEPPPWGREELPPWPGADVAPPHDRAPERPQVRPQVRPRPAPPLAPRVRRGLGLLLVGTALGMLAGAVAMLVR